LRNTEANKGRAGLATKEADMSIDNCQVCDKRLDTDFVEYQVDGSLYCDNCLDEMELEPVAEQGTDWQALVAH